MLCILEPLEQSGWGAIKINIIIIITSSQFSGFRLVSQVALFFR